MALNCNVVAKLAILLITIFLMANTAASLRDFPVARTDLATRLQAASSDEGETNDCWTALSELRQCSNEVVAFFLNGQTDIDTPCCNAIKFITSQCWPSMLSVLGFTAQEGNLLAGYCDKSSSAPAGAPPTTTVAFVDDHATRF